MPPDFDVAVVGGGIVGGIASLSLARRSLRVALIESGRINAQWQPSATGVAGFDARVNALNPASVKCLQSLGAWERLDEARCLPFSQMEVWDGEGDGEIRFGAEELGLEQLGWIVEHSPAMAAIAAAVLEDSEIEVFEGAALEECRDIGDFVSLRLADGVTIEASLALGADGAHSRVRAAENFGWREWDCRQTAIFASVRSEEPHRGIARQRFLNSGPLAFLPLGAADADAAHCSSIVWSLDTQTARELLALDEDEFCHRLAEAFEGRLGEMLEIGPRRSVELRQGHADRYFRGRLALAGDAAHVLHPLAGQGVNLGIADAVAFAERLSGWDRRSPATRLRRYQLQRWPFNFAMLGAMHGFRTLFAREAPELAWLRGLGMRAVEAAMPLKRMLMRQALGEWRLPI